MARPINKYILCRLYAQSMTIVRPRRHPSPTGLGLPSVGRFSCLIAKKRGFSLTPAAMPPQNPNGFCVSNFSNETLAFSTVG